MKIVLFLGRFQPFHNGHLKVLKELSKEFDKVIIAVGSKQYRRTPDNPFSYTERAELIGRIVKNRGIRNAEIIGIEDIDDNSRYVEHVEELLRPLCIDVVATGNELVKKLFGKEGYNVMVLPRYYGLHAENLRRRILEAGTGKAKMDFSKYVPEEVNRFLVDKGVKIIKQSLGRNPGHLG